MTQTSFPSTGKPAASPIARTKSRKGIGSPFVIKKASPSTRGRFVQEAEEDRSRRASAARICAPATLPT